MITKLYILYYNCFFVISANYLIIRNIYNITLNVKVSKNINFIIYRYKKLFQYFIYPC